MKEFLEKFGLTEILGHLFPGFIALCALVVWVDPVPTQFLGTEMGGNEFLLGVFLLIFAYAAGLMLSMWGLAGAHAAEHGPTYPGGPWPPRLNYSASWLKWKFNRLAAGMPPNCLAAIQGLTEIEDLLKRVYGPSSMPLLLYPSTQLSIFRAIFCDRIKDKTAVVLAEPEIQRRRFMFSLGVALALMILAASALARCALGLLASIPHSELQLSARWRSDLSLALLALLVGIALWSSTRIWRRHGWHALALGIGALLCAVSARLWMPGLPRASVPAFDPAMLATIALSLASVAVCFLLRGDVALAGVLLFLCVVSIACVVGTCIAHFPLLWIAPAFSRGALSRRRAFLLSLLAVAAYFISWRLRKVAAQCFERELVHTLAAARLFGHYF